MEGALVRLLALASLKKDNITIELAKEIIQDLLGDSAIAQISLENICRAVSKELKVKEASIFSQTRQMDVANARHVAMFLSRELTKLSLVHIGRFFGDRDHSTVIHACKTIEKKIGVEKNMSNLVLKLKNKLIN